MGMNRIIEAHLKRSVNDKEIDIKKLMDIINKLIDQVNDLERELARARR